ncbi:MAG: hypothetical protein COB36_00680 [Alphaproteobacteria bacterium]|nr:MAG: hypothetical protein COB36_00680 [Alphaproteobacteria bacterium]
MKKTLVFLCLIYICTGYSKPAVAIEPLDYEKKISPSLRYQIDLFLKETYDTTLSQYKIAGIDLNNDGINEHILKQRRCNVVTKQCTHLILAEKKNEILLLSKIKAYNLMIGGTNSYGIKDVLAFTNEINDYNFDIYMWSPSRKMYILRAE